ncbi:hypothetical protein ACHAWO_004161 [Cyclotella atomus]|jgi:hypothetical protein|uniref:Chitin-binding type-1 domain-containing protein n=1 Tax=Cyclotella atomus TaxID=382360 RepID=A0ABD3NMI3_9STRA
MAVQMSLSQNSIENPSVTQCLAAPCDYVGECRSDSNTCGEGSSYCNDLSIWVPACGGGGTLEKEPALTETASTAQASVQDDIDSQTDIDLTDTNTIDNPSPTPTTAWEAWTNNKNNGQSGNNQGVIGYTTGKEGEEDWAPSEEPGWFDKQGWESGNRTKGEDESIFSKYNPFSRNEEDNPAISIVAMWSLTAAFMLISVFEVL